MIASPFLVIGFPARSRGTRVNNDTGNDVEAIKRPE